MKRNGINSQKRRRRGIQVLELIIALPVIIFATVAGLQFGLMMVVHHTVRTAATEAVREAAKGASVAEVGSIVDEILGVHSIAIGSGVSVIVEDATGTVGSLGDATLLPNNPAVSLVSPEIRVTIIVNFDQTPLPNALVTCGIDFSNNRYEASAIARNTCT